jgi:tetratricopeptide (TPR) repeat protein
VVDAADVAAPDGAVRTVDGELIRTWMVTALERENQASEAGERVTVWHDGLPRTQKRNRLPVLTANDAEGREAQAAALAKAIDADVVISGHIEEDGGRRQLVQEFYLFSRLAPEASESIGRYTFGSPIPLSRDLAGDSLNRESVAAQIDARTALLYRIVLALREDVLGKHEAALALLLDTENELGLRNLSESQLVAKSRAVSGLDTLYFFLGREALFLGRDDEAEDAARRALAINEGDVRASIILGGALMGQAEALDPLEALSPGGFFDEAEIAYRAALDNAPLTSTTHAVAQLALAHVHVSRGAALYMGGEGEATDTEADILFDEAVNELSPLLNSLAQSKQYRMIAQCRSYMGAARLYQGSLALQMQDPERASGLFEEAREHFAACVAQGDELPEDATLRIKIIAEGCAPGQQQASQALAEIGGG